MNKSTYHIALEIDRHVSQGSMSVRRGESGRELVLALLSGGKPYDPGEGAYAVLAAKKPDGTTLFNGCLLKNGRIHYVLTPQTTSAPGRAECEARIYDATGELIVSPKFALVIYETAIEDEEVSSSSEATALTALVSEAQRALEDIDAAGITACEVTVDANSGAPSASAELKDDARGKILALTFSGLKGERGVDGVNGTNGVDGAPGEKGDKGDRGEAGAAFTYADFTPEQLAALKGEKGDPGKDGAPGAKGDKGDKGERGEKGEKGDTGDTGAAFTVRGFYQSAEALSAAVTAPSVGDAYGVGESAPYDIYIYDTATAAWINNGPLQGAKGDTGAAFTYADFTPEQLAGLKGDKGDPGKDGAKGDKGDKGDTGAAFTYEDFTPEQLAALKGEKGDPGQNGTNGVDGAKGDKGDKGETGAKGDKGDTGAAFTYADFTPEQLAALKGDKGDTGERGEKGDKGDTGAVGATGAQGAKGDKGEKGDTFTFDDLTQAQIAALKGAKGDTGEAGHTPVRGTDYWTAEDQTAIVNAVLDALPSGDEVSY